MGKEAWAPWSWSQGCVRVSSETLASQKQQCVLGGNAHLTGTTELAPFPPAPPPPLGGLGTGAGGAGGSGVVGTGVVVGAVTTGGGIGVVTTTGGAGAGVVTTGGNGVVTTTGGAGGGTGVVTTAGGGTGVVTGPPPPAGVPGLFGATGKPAASTQTYCTPLLPDDCGMQTAGSGQHRSTPTGQG